MSDYSPPVDDIVSALRSSGLGMLCAGSSGPSAADVEGLVAEFGRFAGGVVAPTDTIADQLVVRFDPSSSTVSVPDEVRDAYGKYVASGWGAATLSVAHGGGGVPYLGRLAFEEMLCSANLAFSLNPMLTHGAIDLLSVWGTDDQKSRFLPKLATGEWTGTMNLTEPDAGSDVGAIRSVATQTPGGNWLVRGTKIFVTWGEHDLTSNIIHLVLARTPGAAAGSRGISLFVVPRVLADGTRNSVWCRGVEHKLGLHGSPTCVLEYDDAVAELVGGEGRGMAAMFTMMNSARVAVASEGVATGQRSFSAALDYARQRQQGTAWHDPALPVAIIEHPDVRRMLLDIRATTRAMRLLLFLAGSQFDISRSAADEGERSEAASSAALLTPIVKSWCTDQGFRVASLAVQVHGGAGYIEETGIAQRLRDVRIAPIYEGTNGIQAVDLVTRKLLGDEGVAVASFITRIQHDVARGITGAGEAGVVWSEAMGAAVEVWKQATDWMLQPGRDRGDVLAGATSYLEIAARTLAGWRLGVHADRVVREEPHAAPEALADVEFFAVEALPLVAGYLPSATAGLRRLTAAL